MMPATGGPGLLEDLYEHLQKPSFELSAARLAVASAEQEYLEECQKGNFDYDSHVSLPQGLTPEAMTYIYNKHLRDGSGNTTYEAIVDGVDGARICAFCGMREAESLDHYKEKSRFPLLSVCPVNLVPACLRCNAVLGVRGNKFHGYFDNVSNLQWLGCSLVQDRQHDTPGIVFYVTHDFSDDSDLVYRVSNTFDSINLGRRWAVEFGDVVGTIERGLRARPVLRDRFAFLDDQLETALGAVNGPHATLLRVVRDSAWLRSRF